MEIHGSTTYYRRLGGWGLGVISVLASLVFFVGGATAKDLATSPTPATKGAGLELGELGFESVAARSANGVSVRRKARKPRVWRMPVTVAKRATMRFARSIYSNTTPNEFDDQGLIVGNSDWDDYAAGSCKRKSRSRVNCVGLVEGYFDVVDDQGNPTGEEDTFYCIWEQTNWYPRARQKKLRTDIPAEYCGWESDD